MLHRAVVHIHEAAAVCETLVACGSDVDATNADGDTPLMWAVLHEKINVVRLFLGLNADTTRTNNQGWNVSQTTDAETLQLLSEHSKKTVIFIALSNADVTVSILFRLWNVNNRARKHWAEFALNSVLV